MKKNIDLTDTLLIFPDTQWLLLTFSEISKNYTFLNNAGNRTLFS